MKTGTTIAPKKIARALLSKNFSLASEVKKLILKGANHIEISGESISAIPSDILHGVFTKEISGGLRELHEKQGITYSVHLPFFGGVDFTTCIESIRSESVKMVEDIVAITKEINPLCYVIHISGLLMNLMGVGLKNDEIVNIYLDNAKKSIKEILEFIPSEKLCIENLEYISFNKLSPLVEEFNTKICMDVGHILLRGECVDSFIEKYSHRISEVHLHDVTHKVYDRRVTIKDDHQPLGTGVVNVDHIINSLHKAGFSGPVVLEVQKDDSLISIGILKSAIDNLINR